MGMPVITLCGKTHASRMTASVLHMLGLSHLVADNPGSFIESAVELANNVTTLDNMRAEFRNKMTKSSLCNAAEFTERLEKAYHTMWNTFCNRSHATGSL